ncbi:MFS transporter-like protein [Xylariaceae sp. FL0255]|nr:MFS transporter-like protein [Xylariaceae sp. FL0255]
MAWRSQLQQFLSGTRTPGSKPPYLLAIRSSTTLIVITVCLGIFTDIFLYGLITPVLPFALPQRAGIPQQKVQSWLSILLAAYSAALFIGSPISGLYADRTSSRRWPLILGLLALAGATFLLAFGRSSGLFILGRVLQGLSSSVVWSVGCALLADTMGKNVGVAMGYVNIAMSLRLLLSPLIGGIVYNAVGYQAVWYVAFGVVGLDVILRFVMIEKKVAKQWIGEEESNESASDDTPNEDETPETGSISRETRGSRDVAGQQLPEINPELPAQNAEFEKSQKSGLEDIDEEEQGTRKNGSIFVLLKSPRLLAALYGFVVESGILLGFDAVLALFVERTYGWNSMDVGLLFLALVIPGFIAPLAGWLSDRYGAKWPSFAGFVLTIPALISLRFVAVNHLGHKILLGFLLGILGITLPFSMTPLMAEISYAIEAEEAKSPGIFGKNGALGFGYGLFNLAFALGGIIGPIWAGYVVDEAGWGTLNWSFAIWSASAAVVVLIWLKSHVKKSSTSDTAPEEGNA